jgi:hypothetical protein
MVFVAVHMVANKLNIQPGAAFDAGVYAFSTTDEAKAYPVALGDQGYPDDYSLNLWFKKIGGTGLDVVFTQRVSGSEPFAVLENNAGIATCQPIKTVDVIQRRHAITARDSGWHGQSGRSGRIDLCILSER